MTHGEKAPGPYERVLDLSPYSGEERGCRTAEEWETLVKAADAKGEFLQSSRNRKRVCLDAELRLSSAAALEMAFKATKGHLLKIAHLSTGKRYETGSCPHLTVVTKPFFRSPAHGSRHIRRPSQVL